MNAENLNVKIEPSDPSNPAPRIKIDAPSVRWLFVTLWASVGLIYRAGGRDFLGAFVAFALAECKIAGWYFGRPVDWFTNSIAFALAWYVVGLPTTIFLAFSAFAFSAIWLAWE